MSRRTNRNASLTLLVVTSIFVTSLVPPPALAQNDGRKPVVISFGQPNIWSLDQAHYLLARMHMTNLELQAAVLERAQLDPNATHGTRIQILKQLLEVGVSYDQGIGFANQRLVEKSRFNDTRRRDLVSNRDRMRAQSLQLELDINKLKRDRAAITDPESERAKKLDAEIEENENNQAAIDKEIDFHNSEIGTLAEPEGTPSAPAVPTTSPLNDRLPSSLLDKLSEDAVNKLIEEKNDSKLNATTKLDNTIHLQYEIIAKQLTLLRDEVGPGERLVFLELPQSLYTTPGRGDEKMAQTWWHVNGYTRTDPLLRLLLELYEVEWKWKRIQKVTAFANVAGKVKDIRCAFGSEKQVRALYTTKVKFKVGDVEQERDEVNPESQFAEMFHEFRCEREAARERVLRNIFREASSEFDRIQQGGARDTSETLNAILKKIATEAVVRRHEPDQIEPIGIELKAAAKTQEELLQLRKDLLELLSQPDPKIDGDKPPAYTFDQAMEYVPLDPNFDHNPKASPTGSPTASPSPYPTPTPRSLTEIERRLVRTVDIIPRQSSLNVNDIQSTVKATGILAAFKFLFGFAGQVNFQRQREQYEQFVHQELYASGFGKGSRDFGWTFGALPGTNRVAPGVRTTYAALVVPDDADSIVLSARGCYFPRKNYQPLNFEDTGHADWVDPDRFSRNNCADQQTYVLTIPGGGNTSSFWVTSVNYEPVKAGEFVTISVRGKNFSSQMGVLVNGVPLHATVGLAQPHLLPKKEAEKEGGTVPPHPSECAQANGICGRYERVDQEQIVFSFKLPDSSTIGIPTITLVAPGKSVDLNSLINLRVNGTQLGKDTSDNFEFLVEKDKRVPFMFGVRPSDVLSITNLQFLQTPTSGTTIGALLTGTGLTNADTIYVNGVQLIGPNRVFKSPTLYELTLPLSSEDTYNVTVVQNGVVTSKEVRNPLAFQITSAEVTRFEPQTSTDPGFISLKLIGVGFTSRIQPGPMTGAQFGQFDLVSPTLIVLRLRRPNLPIVIRLHDPLTGRTVPMVISTVP